MSDLNLDMPASAARRTFLQKAWMVAAVAVGGSIMDSSAFAHHGWASFDTRYAYFVAGTVTYVRWGNPHSEVHIRVETTALPSNWNERPLPSGADEDNGRSTMASARPYGGEQKELHLVLAGPGWMERWGLNRPLQVGETVEAVGFLGAAESVQLRPVMFWLEDGQGVWQQLTSFPQPPEPAAQ